MSAQVDDVRLQAVNAAREHEKGIIVIVMPEPRHENTVKALAGKYTGMPDGFPEALTAMAQLVAEGIFTMGKPPNLKTEELPGVAYTLTAYGWEVQLTDTGAIQDVQSS